MENTKNYEVRTNQWGATDIHFSEKPSKSVIELLKANGFRWFGKTESWSSFKVKAEDVEAMFNGSKITTTNVKKEIEREHGLKVGDILELSFGYDETHYCFFVITELLGKKSVKIREVYPKIIETQAISSMSEDRVYSTTQYEFVSKDRSIWIDDNDKGAVKQVSDFYKDENGKAIAVKGWHHHTLYKYNGGKCYESWYA